MIPAHHDTTSDQVSKSDGRPIDPWKKRKFVDSEQPLSLSYIRGGWTRKLQSSFIFSSSGILHCSRRKNQAKGSIVSLSTQGLLLTAVSIGDIEIDKAMKVSVVLLAGVSLLSSCTAAFSPAAVSPTRPQRVLLSQVQTTTTTTSSTTRRWKAKTQLGAAESKDVAAAHLLDEDGQPVEPKVFPQRWVQLGYLSALALLSDWICFSVAASPGTYEEAFGHSAASIIDVFLFTNVASSFLVTDVVSKFGLKRAIQGASFVMAVGCWLRSGLFFLTGMHLVSYPFILAGTVLVGAAQPFFQCTPPLLSATWFAASERATSTAVALNFNQIGIATAFIVGGAMATTATGLAQYFGLIAVLCTAVMAGTFFQFEEEPPVPPSQSELEKKLSGENEPPFLESVQTFFATRGFTKALAAFVCSISVTNIVGAFIDDVMERGGVHNQLQIDLAGAGFELAILLGGIVIGGYVDRTKEYKKVTMACLAATAFAVIPLGLTEHAIGQSPILLLASLMALGVAAGPVQPINAELAVDVTYPGDETAVESVQQIGGNLISALLVPVAELAARQDYQILPKIPWAASDVRGDVLLLFGIAGVTLAYFSSFDAPLTRTMADVHGQPKTLSTETLPAPPDMDSPIVTNATKPLSELHK